VTALPPPTAPESHGADPAAFAELARRLHRAAGGLAAAARQVPAALPRHGWRGVAAAAFQHLLAADVQRLAGAAQACAAAAQALDRYAVDLAEAQALPPGDQAAERTAMVARRACAVLEALAGAAASRSGARGTVERLAGWRAEIGLGAGEALEGLAGMGLRLAQSRALTDPAGFAADAWATVGGGLDALRHPARLAGDLVDAGTWRRNPARAVGHLLPDVAAAVISGGSVTAARRSLAEVGRSARQARLREVAEQSRRRFVGDAVRDVDPSQRVPWHGDGGLRLPADVHAAARAYWRALRSAEPELTARIRAMERSVGGRLAGLEHRLKTPESLGRKLATAGLGGSDDAVEALAAQLDTLRFTLVIATRRYRRGVAAAGAWLDRSGMSLTRLRNAWDGPGYRGINSTWTDPGTGVRFEIQFHTPQTRRATVLTHPWYEASRSPELPEWLRREWQDRIGAVYATARRPRGVERITPDAAALADRPGYAFDAAAAAAAGTGLSRAGRRPAGSARPVPSASRRDW